MDQIAVIIKKVILHLEEYYEKELDALVEAGRLAKDGDSIPLELSINEELLIEDRTALSDSGISLEQRLYQHVYYYINNAQQRERQLMTLLQEAIGTFRRIPVIYEGMITASVSRPIDAILLFSPFWIRDPLHWDKNSNVSIIEHLFVKYPVPEKLYEKWYETLDTKNTKYLVWFILLAQGGSLKKASKWFGWNTPSRFQHYFVQLVKDYSNSLYEVSILDLIMGAEISRLGGSDRHMILFSQNPVFRIDPTEENVQNKTLIRFWYQTVYWFINNGQYVNDNQYEAILQWAAHQYTEAEKELTFFSWKGRTADNVIEASAEYLHKLESEGENIHWDYHGLDWRFMDDSGKVWTVNEITNGVDLSREGKSLMHCAGDYASKCMIGTSVVFSMKCNQERVATIELDGKLKNVRQAKGYSNRKLTQKEITILNLWFRQQVTPEEQKYSRITETTLQDILLRYRIKDFESCNSEGNYILHEAVLKRNIADVHKILDLGFDIDLTNNSGKTALMIAVEKRYNELVSELIERDADLNVTLCPKRNALAIALEREDVGIVRILMRNKTEVWPHHLVQALKKKQRCFINILISMGADINRSTPRGVTALNLAVKNEDFLLVNKLQRLGANIDLPTYIDAKSCTNSAIARRIKESEKAISKDFN